MLAGKAGGVPCLKRAFSKGLGGRMRRRDFVTLAGGAAAWPFAARAQQQGRKARIGFLSSLPDNPLLIASYAAFSDEMRRLGWVENQNLTIEYRYINDPKADFAAQVAELVRSNIDLFVTGGPETPLQIAFNATRTIPIAMIAVNFDPIARGYVASLARPGGNVTGIFFRQLELAQKQLELLTQAFPERKKVAVLYDAISADQFTASEQIAAQMNLELRGVKLENAPYDFNAAFHTLAQGSPQMLLVQSSPYFTSSQRLIAGLAIEQRLPTMFIFKTYVETGGLMSYGVDYVGMNRRIAGYVAKILEGAKPADIPVEQPTKFEFVVNLKTAKAIGVEIPLSIQLRADQVIE
jgi:putative tryptophan/tyrosine transport system substrate-binding protein